MRLGISQGFNSGNNPSKTRFGRAKALQILIPDNLYDHVPYTFVLSDFLCTSGYHKERYFKLHDGWETSPNGYLSKMVS